MFREYGIQHSREIGVKVRKRGSQQWFPSIWLRHLEENVLPLADLKFWGKTLRLIWSMSSLKFLENIQLELEKSKLLCGFQISEVPDQRQTFGSMSMIKSCWAISEIFLRVGASGKTGKLAENPLWCGQKKGTQYKRLKVSWIGGRKPHREQSVTEAEGRGHCQNETRFEKCLLARAVEVFSWSPE